MFDGFQWHVIKSMSQPRVKFAAVTCNDKIYAIAGRSFANRPRNQVSGDVQVYNFGEETWNSVADLNYPREGHSACVVGGKIYVAGGTNSLGNLAPVEVYDPADENAEWKVLGEFSDKKRLAVFDFSSF